MPPEHDSDTGLAALIEKVEREYTFADADHAGRTDTDAARAAGEVGDDAGPSDPDDADQADAADATTSTDHPDGDSDASGDDATATGETDETDDEDSDEDADDDEADEPTPDEKPKAYQLPKALEAIVAQTPADQQEALRSAIGTRLGEMQAGMTRAQQQAAELRREVAAAKARTTAEDADPVTAIVARFEADPKLLDQVNAQLDALDADPSAKGKAKAKLDDAAKVAVQQLDDREAFAATRAARGDAVEQLARGLAAKAGVPFHLGLEEAIAAQVILRGPEGDLTDDEVRAIVKEYAGRYVRHTAATKREALKKDRQEKVKDRAKPRPTIPGGATPAAPGRAADKAMTLEAKMLRSAERIFPGAK